MSAQEAQFKRLGEKYQDKEGYKVLSVGRNAIRMAALAGDKESRKVMRKLEMMVAVTREGERSGSTLRGDFDKVVVGFDSLAVVSNDTAEVALYMNPECTGFAMYSSMPKEEVVLLLLGNDLRVDEMIPEDAKLGQMSK